MRRGGGKLSLGRGKPYPYGTCFYGTCFGGKLYNAEQKCTLSGQAVHCTRTIIFLPY